MRGVPTLQIMIDKHGINFCCYSQVLLYFLYALNFVCQSEHFSIFMVSFFYSHYLQCSFGECVSFVVSVVKLIVLGLRCFLVSQEILF